MNHSLVCLHKGQLTNNWAKPLKLEDSNVNGKVWHLFAWQTDRFDLLLTENTKQFVNECQYVDYDRPAEYVGKIISEKGYANTFLIRRRYQGDD